MGVYTITIMIVVDIASTDLKLSHVGQTHRPENLPTIAGLVLVSRVDFEYCPDIRIILGVDSKSF